MGRLINHLVFFIFIFCYGTSPFKQQKLTILCGLPKGLTMFHWLIRDSKTMWNISPKNWASLMTHEANSPTV
jgi:hypothetical protein